MLPKYPQNLLSPFAQNGDKSAIPAITPQGTNAFSYNAGFPTITGQPLSVGGLPPSREDFNAAFNMMSEWIYYMQCGGQVEYSQDVDYPENARVFYNGTEYLCIKENGINTDFGVQAVDNVEYWHALAMPSPYTIGEFKQFLLNTPPQGFLVLNGAVIEEASATTPHLWNYLQSAEGAAFCITEEEWQTQSTSVYYTDVHKTEYSWEGIGGVCAYVIDTLANTIRLPDLRGMYAESAGFDGLEVGSVHADMIRNISGSTPNNSSFWIQSGHAINQGNIASKIGCISTQSINTGGSSGGNSHFQTQISIDTSNAVPTGNANKPRAYGVLECVYVGTINTITGE